MYKKLTLITILLCLTMTAYAEVGDLGSMATSLSAPINAVRYFFVAGSYIIGAGFLVATWFRYLRYRRNPQEAPMSSVLILLVIAIVLLILPYSYQATHHLSATQGMSDVMPGN